MSEGPTTDPKGTTMADTPIGKLTINALEAFVLLAPVVVLAFVVWWAALALVWVYAAIVVLR